MDFSLPEQEQAVAELSRQILGDLSTPERHKQLEADGVSHDEQAWQALADAGLVGISLPEELGGGGLGFLATSLVVEEIGRTTARIPLLAPVAAMALAQFGEDRELLRKLADGSALASPALEEAGRQPAHPATTATADAAGGWRLTGTKEMVPFAGRADVLVAPATTDAGAGLFAVAVPSDGVAITPQETTSGMVEGRVVLTDAPAVRLGTGSEPVRWLEERCIAALSAATVGVVSEALRLTAAYTSQREQFGRPIATFQAVGQRVGDAYIDTEAIRLTALQASWRLDQGLEASTEVAVAKYWAADGGQRVANAAQHLHGGMGVDRDYPLWRYYVWAKHLELTLGGATDQLLRIGDALAAGTA
ncbi:acyl-CoA dehydrogenase family protein [Candidatus Poriferisocius sp.]|uniref:acyl-CoA dehydrogenase family protein n=1 Tax=Candidatus Poriferisocius sp. TaxID=3101276 RepID=UPI003B5CDB0C